MILGELPEAVPAAVGGPGSGKFAVPQILPLGTRPKTPTTPPSAAARPKKLTQPPVVAPINTTEESGRNKTASVPPSIPGLPNTKATTLGAGCMLAAAALYFDDLGVTTRALATIVFLVATAPVAAHTIGRAAYFARVPLWDGMTVDELHGRYDPRTHALEGDAGPAGPAGPAE